MGVRRRARFGVRVFDKPGAAGDKLALARAMRVLPTAAEAVLWSALRGRRLGGWKFRRQHVIAGYIVDFYCAPLWLAVEVDGAVHQGRRVDDRERDDHLASLGVHVVRLLNADVLERFDAVVGQLARCCERLAQRRRLLLPPHPPRSGLSLAGVRRPFHSPLRSPRRGGGTLHDDASHPLFLAVAARWIAGPSHGPRGIGARGIRMS
jgi:very-short-patch-repair endonuclease